MSQELRIASFDEAARALPRVDVSDVALHLTPEVLRSISETVGRRKPETGAMLLGPWDRGGADRLEFDEQGSKAASGSVYAPDTAWANERVRFWHGQPDHELRVWHGQVHSHPGTFARPSPAAGQAAGDLGYVAEALRVNDAMQDFFLPIVTGSGTADPVLWSWVVSRDDPNAVRFAEVRIGPAADFPARRFNTEWQTRQEAAPRVPLVPLDLPAVARCAGAVLSHANGRFHFTRSGVTVALVFPDRFPFEGPAVSVLGAREAAFPYAWRPKHPRRIELRLGRLITAAFCAARKEF